MVAGYSLASPPPCRVFRPTSITTSKVPRLFSPSDDAPKDEDGRSREAGTLEMMRRAVYGMLYADDAGVVSTSPRGSPV